MTRPEFTEFTALQNQVAQLTAQLADAKKASAVTNTSPAPVAPPIIQNSSENNQAMLTLLSVGRILGFPGDQHILDLPAFATALMAELTALRAKK